MRDDDKKKLDDMLRIIHDELERLVTKQLDLFRQELKEHFPGPWPIIADRIERARDGLKDLDWVYVEGVGLIGRELAFKYDLLKYEVTDGKGTLYGLFKRANSILGTLSKIPLLGFLETVKEYKEQVECSIDDLERIKRKDGKWVRAVTQ